MEIHYVLTNQDVWNFQKYALRRTRALVPLIVLLVLVVVLFFLSTALSPSSGSPTNLFAYPVFFLLFSSIFIILLFISILVMLRWRLRSGTSRTLALQGEITLVISPEGYRLRNNLSDAMNSWRAVKSIAADTHNLYFIVHSNRLMGHVIPRRAFATPQEAETFLALAQSYWANNQAAPPARPAGPSVPYERWS